MATMDIENDVLDRHQRGTPYSSTDFENMTDKEHTAVISHSGNIQRKGPEEAMLAIQRKLGPGLYSFAVEHTGDLYWRTHHARMHGRSEHDEVGNKIDKVLRTLTDRYGFEREMRENLRGNSAYDKDPSINWDTAVVLGKAYAKEHNKLPVYNLPASLMVQATNHLGNMRFGATAATLEQLKELHNDEDHWEHLHSRQGSINYLKSIGK